MDFIEEIVSRVERIERNLRNTSLKSTDVNKTPRNVLGDNENQVDHMERILKENALQERKDRALPMNVMDGFAIRVERIEVEVKDAPAEKSERSALPARVNEKKSGGQDCGKALRDTSEGCSTRKGVQSPIGALNEVTNQIERIEREMKDLTPQEKNFNFLLMNVLYEIANRMERIESHMRDAHLRQADKASFSVVLDEIVNRVERMERDLRSLMDAMDEIANRVERLENQMMSAPQEKRDKMSSTFVAEDNLNGMMRVGKETGEYAAQDDHKVSPMETKKATEERRSSQSGLSSLENVRNKEAELRLRKCVLCNGNHWQEHGRRYSSSS
ncbi:unnamed protein product [Cylicocyclus nassatus]|uniref:Uncharacterized protein n=1 Tax=Cylicocyclus nassatus TaxID=53992 RepID=A0AA36GW74_CYLNA|nr:unnamed protein product [Cylicocyclus nassatus]